MSGRLVPHPMQTVILGIPRNCLLMQADSRWIYFQETPATPFSLHSACQFFLSLFYRLLPLVDISFGFLRAVAQNESSPAQHMLGDLLARAQSLPGLLPRNDCGLCFIQRTADARQTT